MKMAKIVYLGMIGDIMHPGLINIINQGAKYGDVMIGLFTDKAIATHKRLPYLTYEQRKNVIENIKGVVSVVPQDDWSYVPNLLKYKPDYIIHGDDWLQGPDKYIRDDVFKTMEKDFKLTNLKVNNPNVVFFFKQYDERLLKLFDEPISKFEEYKEENTKFLDFSI